MCHFSPEHGWSSGSEVELPSYSMGTGGWNVKNPSLYEYKDSHAWLHCHQTKKMFISQSRYVAAICFTQK
jgi:hypothetical protein